MEVNEKAIDAVGFGDDVRLDMQAKINRLYECQPPLKDFSLYYPFDISQLREWEGVLEWDLVSSNREIKWSEQLILSFKDKWIWSKLILNDSILCWDESLLELLKDKIIWDEIDCISIDWAKELHDRFGRHLNASICESENKNRFLENKRVNDFSEQFMELYLYAKSLDEKEGIFILYDAIEIYLYIILCTPYRGGVELV